MNTRYTLYGAKTGNCLRAAIALEEAGIAYDIEHLALLQGEHKHEAFLAINPFGLVPALIVEQANGNQTVITQSNAIVLYAAENAVGADIIGRDPLARARTLERFFYFLTDVIAPSHAGFRIAGSGFSEAAQLLDQKVISCLSASETFVRSNPYMAGDAFSIADIAAFTVMAVYQGKLDWPAQPALHDWFNRVAQREGVKLGMTKFD